MKITESKTLLGVKKDVHLPPCPPITDAAVRGPLHKYLWPLISLCLAICLLQIEHLQCLLLLQRISYLQKLTVHAVSTLHMAAVSVLCGEACHAVRGGVSRYALGSGKHTGVE